MTTIKGIYRIPNINLTFFILPDECICTQQLENKKSKEYFEHIDLYLHHTRTNITQRWTLILVHECDFLGVIRRLLSKVQVLTNQSFRIPAQIENLVVNQIKIETAHSERTYHTPKILSNIPDDDLIDIFI